MPSPISVYIEMPSYLKKYLIFKSENKQEPLVFPRKSEYNLLLINLVSNRTDNLEKDRTKYNEVCKIKLPFNEIKNIYFYNKLNIDAKAKFRSIISNNFLYEFRMLLKNKKYSFSDRKEITKLYFLSMKITDDDLNYDSFYRNFSRYIEKNRSNVAIPQLNQLNSIIVR